MKKNRNKNIVIEENVQAAENTEVTEETTATQPETNESAPVTDVANESASENVSENVNADANENVAPANENNDNIMNVDEIKVDKAFPISKRTKRDQSKTSVAFSVVSIILYVLAYVPIIAVSLVLAIKCYNLMPYYSFWPFIGVILAGIFGLVFMTITLVVTRKKSKKSIRSQTVRTLIAYVCLTCGFGLILTYIFPDVIANATQGTIKCEDLYYNSESQAETNAKLERDYIMYNILNGNLNEFTTDEDGNVVISENGDYSYSTLSKRISGTYDYENDIIQANFDRYMDEYTLESITGALDSMRKKSPRKMELYDFIYKNYILNDYDYAFKNTLDRRALCLAITDYVYTEFKQSGGYEGLLKEGFNNPRLKQLYVNNYNSFNQDGYLTFDDPLLLYAQMDGRMTVPVILRLILNKGWSYTQSGVDDMGSIIYSNEDNFLYQLYDKALVDEYVAGGGTFAYDGTIVDQNGKEVAVKYGFNEDGWMVYENGYTRRPINWLVLDMLGDPMALTSIDNSIVGIVINVLDKLGAMNAVGGLIQVDLKDLLGVATNGSDLNIGLCTNDDGELEINLFSMNAPYAMLGYMQATWVESNNLLMAVINVVALRNWFSVLGAVGVVLIVMAGIMRDMGEKTRKRTEDSRDRIILAKDLENNDVQPQETVVA